MSLSAPSVAIFLRLRFADARRITVIHVNGWATKCPPPPPRPQNLAVCPCDGTTLAIAIFREKNGPTVATGTFATGEGRPSHLRVVSPGQRLSTGMRVCALCGCIRCTCTYVNCNVVSLSCLVPVWVFLDSKKPAKRWATWPMGPATPHIQPKFSRISCFGFVGSLLGFWLVSDFLFGFLGRKTQTVCILAL